jgi:beta-aspartyl-peptidase (threonine type)
MSSSSRQAKSPEALRGIQCWQHNPMLERGNLHDHQTEKPNMTIRRCGWAVFILALATVAPTVSGHGSEDPNDPVAAVRAVLSRQVDDWNKGDLDAFLTSYWNSPQVVFMSGGQRFDGFEAMRDRYRRRYKSEGRAMGQLVFSELDVEALGPHSVMARGRFRLTMPDGTKPTGLFTVILRKLPDGWKIVHDHTSTEPSAPPPTQEKPAQP